ncbi:HAD family phosphatase [Nocardia sp. AG03]|uniref:HAD family hydrolase n=1 Tax=Nocardia sp. AG03 TaxID=3025312 RepID=UPI002418934B|nr:HAD family phosphatase [Nocardia sp. AG03]
MSRTGVLFDLDGLLVETESKWSIVERSFYTDRGLEFTATHKKNLIGKTLKAVVSTIGEDVGRTDYDILHRQFVARLLAEFDGVELLPGAAETLRWANSLHLTAVVTNSPAAIIGPSLSALRRDGVMPELVITADDVVEGKPQPDSYNLALSRLGLSPDRAIALEDSVTGIAAARAAGLRVLGVSHDRAIEARADWYSEVLSPELVRKCIEAAALSGTGLRSPSGPDEVGPGESTQSRR